MKRDTKKLSWLNIYFIFKYIKTILIKENILKFFYLRE